MGTSKYDKKDDWILLSKTQYKMARLILYALKNDIVDENKLFK